MELVPLELNLVRNGLPLAQVEAEPLFSRRQCRAAAARRQAASSSRRKGAVRAPLPFDLGVELDAQKHGIRPEPKPDEQYDDRAYRAVGLVVAGKSAEVDREAVRADDPEARGCDGTRARPFPQLGSATRP